MIIYTSNNDVMLVTLPDNTKIGIMGKQAVIIHYIMKRIKENNNKPVMLTRLELRNNLDKYFVDIRNDKEHPLYAIANRLNMMFNARGEFSNALKSLVVKNVLEERPIASKGRENTYAYTIKPFVIEDYILYSPEKTSRRSKEEQKISRKEYKKAYQEKNREELNRKRRLKYSLEKLKSIEKANRELAKSLEKVAKLKEMAKLKEERRLAAIERQKQKALEKEAKKNKSKTPIISNITRDSDIKIDPSTIVTSSNCKVAKEKTVIMSASSSTVNSNKHYQPYQASGKYKVREKYIHGEFKAVSPGAKTKPKRELKRRYVTKDMVKRGRIIQVSPFELEDMIKDYLNKGKKIKVYDQVSEDIKAVVQGPDRKTILNK